MFRRNTINLTKRLGFASSTRFKRFNSDFTTINQSEKDHFNKLAATWWDPHGPQRILHKMNLIRMDFINDTIKSHLKLNEGISSEEEKVFIPGWNYKNLLPSEIAGQIEKEQKEAIANKLNELELKCLDVGCGGGLLSESLARLNVVSSVKGIDLSPEVLKVADKHRELDPLVEPKLNYELKSLEDLSDDDQFDVVTMMEMLEHVDYPAEVLKAGLSHVKPGGLLFLSTINRDFVSWFTTIFMGEYVLKIVPIGTHTYSKYINQSEIKEFAEEFSEEYEVVGSKGCIYLPACGWKFTSNENVGNYFTAIRRKESTE